MFRKKQASHFDSDDAEQRQAKIKELRASLGPLSGRGEKYCNEACLIRYLEARNWNVDKSGKMLKESLKWRAAKRPEDIRWPDVSIEAETGVRAPGSIVHYPYTHCARSRPEAHGKISQHNLKTQL